MDEDQDQDIRAARVAIGRHLATQFAVERKLPEPLQALVNQLKRQDEQPAQKPHT